MFSCLLGKTGSWKVPNFIESSKTEKIDNGTTEQESYINRGSGLVGQGASIVKEDFSSIKNILKINRRNENLIKEAISKNEFLNQVLKGKKRLQAVVDAMYPREVAADEIIINEGSVGTQLYISASGSYEITIKGESIFKFEDNRVFGLVAILYNVKRLATIQALTKGNIWVLDQNVYQKLINLKNEIELAFLEKVSKLNTVSKQVLSRATDLNWKFYRTRYIAVTKESKAKEGKMKRSKFFRISTLTSHYVSSYGCNESCSVSCDTSCNC